jgi:hypothetical protein
MDRGHMRYRTNLSSGSDTSNVPYDLYRNLGPVPRSPIDLATETMW